MLFCIYRRHLLLLLRLLSLPLLSLLRVLDQVGHTIMSTPPYPSDPAVHDQEMHILNSKIMIVAVSSLLVITSLVMLLHVYAKWWFVRNSRRTRLPIPDLRTLSQLQQITSIVSIDDTDAINGLESSIVAALPSFIYKLDGQKNRVECVVCLRVLEENDKGRILPKCQHVFHADCIDKWLVLHSTCPICRVVVVGPDESMAATMVHDVGPSQSQTSVVEPLDGYDGVDVAVEMPVDSRSENQASKDSFSSSSAAAASASLSVSLRRMLSRSRLECRVFPSDHVNDV